ncbi:hypothetical protein [Mucilaginibacter antarcticus]|uniref:Uncharacterized protein n=2 Tax=Mucilaginibacter antarcticus TaxID=1855725 RepID=A0ABW5XMM9_9SPHI
MKPTTNLIKLALLMLLFSAHIATAQKLPNKQQATFRSPAKLKIDGIVNEWGDRLQAYNHSTQIFYAISNDDKNLYLIVQAKHEEIISKIIRGGITLVVNHSLNKKDPAPVTVTYPMLRGIYMSKVANMVARKFYKQPDTNYVEPTVVAVNKVIDENSKTIVATGIKALDSDTLSVYNTEGIKAIAHLDVNKFYNYELAIPIKYLELAESSNNSFSYQLKVNG